jgi:hypothetical protein
LDVSNLHVRFISIKIREKKALSEWKNRKQYLEVREDEKLWKLKQLFILLMI